jgi:hypothetical protein
MVVDFNGIGQLNCNLQCKCVNLALWNIFKLKTFGGGLCHSPNFGFVSNLKHDKGSGPRKCIGS